MVPEDALVSTRHRQLDGWVAAWLDEKAHRTNSQQTEKTYRETMRRFRAALQAQGLDLDSPAPLVALVAQRWASAPTPTDYPSHAKRARQIVQVANSTHNQRLSVVSSFYGYVARLSDWQAENPITRLKWRPVRPYQGAQPLREERVRERLEQLTQVEARASERTQLAALRDYALLQVALTTGRRAAELAGLSWQHVERDGHLVRLTFARTKGGKPMRDWLEPEASYALLAWLKRCYGELESLDPETPLFVSVSNWQRGHRLVHSSLSRILKKRLDTSKVHATRHTFTAAMMQERASLPELAGRLGQDSVLSVSWYVRALVSDVNPYGPGVAARFTPRRSQGGTA